MTAWNYERGSGFDEAAKGWLFGAIVGAKRDWMELTRGARIWKPASNLLSGAIEGVGMYATAEIG